MRNIVLIGFMGSGKTAVGRQLAAKMGYKFVDTDSIIEETTGRTISVIFREKGEGYFRQLESDIVKDLSELRGHVISTGGGIVINRDNLTCLKKSGFLVWLKASPEAIYRRAASESHRPLLDVENPLDEIKRLLGIRERLYSEADISVETDDLDIENIVDIIIEAYNKSK